MGRYNSGENLGGSASNGAGAGNGAVLNAIFGVGDIYGQGRVLPFFRSGRFIVPAGVTSIRSQLWGAGGRGNKTAYRFAGGGGGGFSMSIIPVKPGQVVEIALGAGGNLATPDGGVTTLMLDGVLIHKATGGKAGPATTVSSGTVQGGEGGIGSGGTVCNFQGGNGGSILVPVSSTSDYYGTGGGAAATRFGKGGNGGNLTAVRGSTFASGGGSVFYDAWSPTGDGSSQPSRVGGGAGTGSPQPILGGKAYGAPTAGLNIRGFNMGPDILGSVATYNSETPCPFQQRYLGEYFYGGGGAGVLDFTMFGGVAGSGGVGAGGGGSTASGNGSTEEGSGGSGGAFGGGGGGVNRGGNGGIAAGGGGGGGFGGDGYVVIEW